MTVVVVTDSSAGLPGRLAESHGVRTVPLHVLAGGRDYREGVDEVPPRSGRADAYTSAGASPGELEQAYGAALEASRGSGVVAVHLARALSGTYDAACRAAERVGPGVRVIDSGAAGMAMGLPVLEAARFARSGADADAVSAAASDGCARAFGMVYVHRVDDLRRGGRLGGASALMTSALSVRLVLRMSGGALELRDKMRIPSKALRKVVDRVVEELDGRPARLAVQHWQAPERAEVLEQGLREHLGPDLPVHLSTFGPVMGLHLGAGAAAVAVLPDAAR